MEQRRSMEENELVELSEQKNRLLAETQELDAMKKKMNNDFEELNSTFDKLKTLVERKGYAKTQRQKNPTCSATVTNIASRVANLANEMENLAKEVENLANDVENLAK